MKKLQYDRASGKIQEDKEQDEKASGW
jgi:hypothetical protein